MKNNLIKILFVDDDPHILDGIRRLLSMNAIAQNWDINYASNGYEALILMLNEAIDNECSDVNEYDIVVTDINMPRMDGVELIKRASKTFPEISFVVLSGHYSQSQTFAKLGPNVFHLEKPVSGDLLVHTIQSLL